MKLDDIDYKIMDVLQRNAKTTTKELATIVGLSPSPVFERQKRLERTGYIKKYIAVLDDRKLCNGITAFCNITLKQHSKKMGEDFINAIQAFDEIVECHNTSGDYDYMIKILVRDMPTYQDFVLNKLGTLSSIGSIHTIFSMGEMKNDHYIPIQKPVEEEDDN